MAEKSLGWWRVVEPSAIPSKMKLHRSFVAVLGLEQPYHTERYNTAALMDSRSAYPSGENTRSKSRRVLDLGSGDGRIAVELAQHGGLEVVGVDVNSRAVHDANAVAVSRNVPAVFHVGDCAPPVLQGLPQAWARDGTYDIVLAQLLMSVVGGLQDRQQLLRLAYKCLRPGGSLLLSASGVSDDINEAYAAQYARGLAETGENFSYFSRDVASDQVLYLTHHFTFLELRELLETSGFVLTGLHKEKEASSRRPEEAAWFLYAVATKLPEKATADHGEDSSAKSAAVAVL